METAAESIPQGSFVARTARSSVVPAAFLLLVFLYVWLRIDVRLIYHTYRSGPAFPCFVLDRAFAGELLGRAGGPVEYASSFLSQLYHSAWLGAGAVAVVAGLLSLAAHAYLKAVFGTPPRLAHFIPAILFVLPYSRYGNPMRVGLGVLVPVSLACAYACVAVWRAPVRLVAFVTLGGLAYYLAGDSFLLYVVLCGLLEMVRRRRYVYGMVCLVLGAAAPGVGAAVSGAPLGEVYSRFLPAAGILGTVGGAALALLYLSLPMAIFGALLWRGGARVLGGRPARGEGGAGRESASALAGTLRRLASPLGALPAPVVRLVALLILAGAPFLLAFDGQARSLLRIDYCARHGMWERLLGAARRLPLSRQDMMVAWEVNRALYHTGRLLEGMFSFPQSPRRLFPIPRELDTRFAPAGQMVAPPAAYAKCSDVLIELGRVNEAEAVAHEAWNLIGRRPHILRTLALINAVKGNVQAARAFLEALRRDVVYGRRTAATLGRIETDPSFSADEDVQRLRAVRVKADAGGYFTREELLTQLLATNARNHMAFEYVVAYYLLTRQLDKFASVITYLDRFGYRQIPRHCEEAMLLYAATTGQEIEMAGFRIRPAAIAGFAEFRQILARHKDDLEAARLALRRDYGCSYWFYYVFSEAARERR